MLDAKQIKERVNLQKYAESQGIRPLAGHGDRFACPWRPGADSDGFVIQERMWYDHVTKDGGDAISFVGRLLGLDFRGALRELNAYLGQPAELGTVSRQREPAAVYDYCDENGALLYQVCRYENADGSKTFRQRRPDPARPGQFVLDIKGVRKVLYNLTDISGASTVFVVEGEKDVDRLRREGLVATCNAGGAGKWDPSYNTCFTGKSVVVLADNDEPGRKHAEMVAGEVSGVAVSIKVICISNLRKGDVSDWLEHEGGSREKLLELVGQAPEWKPVADWLEPDDRPVLPLLPPFPLDAMPPVLGRMAAEISETFRVPVEAAALCVLTVAGCCIGRNTYVRVKKGVEARANLFAFIFMARGERKSSLFAPAVIPFETWMSSREASYLRARRSVAMLERRRKSLEDSIVTPRTKAADRERYEKDLEELEQEIEIERTLLRNPMFLAEDVTPEALVDLMSSTGGTVAVFTDDARTLLKIFMGLYTGGETREDIHIKSYDGTSPIRRRRARNDTVSVERPCESMLLMVQVDYLKKLGEEGDFFDSGYISRNLFCYPDSWVGRRDSGGNLLRAYSEREVEPQVANAYESLCHTLLDQFWDDQNVKYVGLTPEAKRLWVEFHDEVESNSGEGAVLHEMLDFSIRYPNQALRLALIIAKCEEHADVTDEDMRRGILLCQHYAVHAQRCHQVMSKHQLPRDAQRVLKRIRERRYKEFSVQQVQRELGLPTAEAARAAIEILCQRSYCRPKPDLDEGKGPGRRPSPTFETNPQLWRDAA